MSNNLCLPSHNSLNKNRSNKENRPNNHMNNRVQGAQKNTFATPSEDDFDDDDDELLIAASQQVERKLAQEKAEVAAKATGTLQLHGEIAILRDQNTKLAREKDQMHIKQLQDMKAQEMKYKKELDNAKSKLEFKDRDIEELKAKIQSDSRSDSYHLAKRPRLSVVKESRTTATALTTTSQQFCVKNFRIPSSVAMSKFCSLNLSEISTDIEHRNLVTFYKGLLNNPDLQIKFNIRSSVDGKCPPSKEILSTMERLFLQANCNAPSSHDKTICLKILSVLLAYNTYPNLEQEVKKLLAALQPAALAQHSTLTETLQHSTLTETLQHSGYNILRLCSRSTSGCQLSALYRHKSRDVIEMLISAVLQVSAGTINHCSCSNKMVMYTCDMIQDSLSGDMLSPTILIRDNIALHQSLQLLSSLSPYLSDMKLNCTTQTLFFGALDLLKKCSSLSMSGQAMVDLLYEAVFDASSSMST